MAKKFLTEEKLPSGDIKRTFNIPLPHHIIPTDQELIDQQKSFDKRTPEANTLFYIDKFSNSYIKNAETLDVYHAFTVLSKIQQESEKKIESIKTELDKFSKKLTSILIPEKENSSSELYQLHNNIELSAKITLSSATVGNFMYGGGNIECLADDVQRYIQLTGQNHNRKIAAIIPRAYAKRFLADKLHYQLIALDVLLERIMLYEYPDKVPPLTNDETVKLEKFIQEKNSGSGTDTPPQLLRDIYFKLKEISFLSHPKLFTKKGTLTIRKATNYALEDDAFSKNWEKDGDNGYSFEWLEKKFKEINKQFFKL